MRKSALIITAVALVVATAAFADRVLTIRTGQVAVETFGDFKQLSDAGYSFRFCGQPLLSDGSPSQLRSCIDCETGGWNGAPATCLAQFKAAYAP